MNLSLTGGRTYTLSTATVVPGVDPVMHVLGTNGLEIATDDNSGGNLQPKIALPVSITGTYRVIIHAASGSAGGSGVFLVNGTQVASAGFGGVPITVPSGTRYVYETVLAPRGAGDTKIYALNNQRAVVAIDDDTGVGLGSRIANRADVATIVVSTKGSGGPDTLHFYVNDPTADADGDGVGTALENELRTCDAKSSFSFCADVFNPRDTDRDGLSDKVEIFGIDDAVAPQTLPAWGADPRHKDMFVEVDYTTAFSSNPLTTADLDLVRGKYLAESADVLGNVDDVPGIWPHFDIGRAAQSNEDSTLFGDWGGSTRVPADTDYETAPAAYMRTVRNNVFRYGLFTSGGGGGQTSGKDRDRFTWSGSTSNRNPISMAHELGHSNGLSHSGHSSWGDANCKPIYQSLMNYAGSFTSFSRATSTIALDPSDAVETNAIGGPATALAADPFLFDVYGASSQNVDWNRDQTVNDHVRAPLTWATWEDCSALRQNFERWDADPEPLDAPVDLLRYRGWLYAFWVGADGALYYRTGAAGSADARGSCPGGSNVGDDCMTWFGPYHVPIASGVGALDVSAVTYGTGVELAFRSAPSGYVRTLTAGGADPFGQLTGWTTDVYAGVAAAGNIELARMYVDEARFGKNEVLALFHSDGTNYRWMTATALGGTFTSQGAVHRTDGTIVKGVIGAGVTQWPSPGASRGFGGIGTACGAFVDPNKVVQWLCYEKASNRWYDDTSFAFLGFPPTSESKPSLAYHVLRYSSGLPTSLDGSRGQFWLSLTEANDAGKIVPRMAVSDRIDGTGSPAGNVRFLVTGKIANKWATMAPNSTVALYEDLDLSALKAVWIPKYTDKVAIHAPEFLPFADGTFSAQLRTGNDFQVMERGLCRGLRDEAWCGATGKWGY